MSKPNQYTVAITAAMLTICLVGCGADSHSKLANQAMNNMEKMVTTMESIKDVPTAKAAVSKLESIGKSFKSLKERVDKLPKISTE